MHLRNLAGLENLVRLEEQDWCEDLVQLEDLDW